MGQELDDLKAAVAAQETVEGSAITLLQQLKAKLDEAVGNEDLDAIKALSAQIGTDTQALANAVTTNTPVDTQSSSSGNGSAAPDSGNASGSGSGAQADNSEGDADLSNS